MNIKFISFIFFIITLLLVAPLLSKAQEKQVFTLTADGLANGKTIELDKVGWKYHSGDDAGWAAKEFDDDSWRDITNEEINSDPAATLENWNGRAWFRLHLQVDESLANQPLALRVWLWGASEIYLDGNLVEHFGSIEANGETEFNPRGLFTPVVFVNGGTHVIAVRQSFQAAADLTRGRGARLARSGFTPGVRLSVESAQGAATRLNNRVRANFIEYVLIGLLAALAAVHLLLFVFYPAERGNLYYSFFVGGLALTIYLNRLYNTGDITAETAYLTDILRNVAQALAVVSLLAFLYIQFIGRVSWVFWTIIALWLVCTGLLVGQVTLPFPYFLVMLVVTFADCLRIIAQSLVRGRAGAWNIAVGVGLLVIGVINNIAFERKIHFLPSWLHEFNLYFALLTVPIAVSIFLARNFARTNKNLEAQLIKEIEHEKEKARLLVVEAENERRAKELEEARQLQLSMLPKKLPELPNLEIAAYMKPATEVGGDYYDFHVGKDGMLTVAVGDATGHGLKAGTVVTATKGLFNAFADEKRISQIFMNTSGALKKMNLRGLFMALTMLKIKDNHFSISAAGMPSTLIYRAATGAVEEISLRAVPLGSLAAFKYQEQEFTLAENDCLIIMSDGFPEMFNSANEMLGFEKAIEILPQIAAKSPQEIINHLVRIGEDWGGGRPQDDDVTFVVLKIGSNGNLN